ncbi:hypothetical protein TRVA0_009S01288 [Trichomonascus vanleenenianus]|uniref:uncharacterized protein n=1 Tax=Trichomonascus vanleenenianus TaxID=2268995 RepID=UPI003ECB621D
MDSERQSLLPLFTPSLLDTIPIYSIVLNTYDSVVSRVDISLKYDQLKSPQIHSFLIKPLLEELKNDFSPGTLYALMANMLQFTKESSSNAAMAGVMATRAMICEIVAIRLLKEYSDPDDLMNALTYDFYPLANGAPVNQLVPRWQRISTLEVAIKAEAKRFLSHPVVIEVLEEIWNGSVMFQSSMHKLHRVRFANEEEVVSAGYGRRGPGVRYKYEDASIFKLSRLRVPRYRHYLNLFSFCILLVLYVAVLHKHDKQFSGIDLIFWLWSLGFIVDEIIGFTDAGFTLYVMSLWNWFDLIILLLLVSYGLLQTASHFTTGPQSNSLAHVAHDLLATVAIFLFPRLFSILDSYEVFSQMVVSVRKMCVDLTVACIIIIIFSSGFWVAFTMAFARDVYSANKVAYDMMKILFGFTPAVWDTWQYYSVLGRTILVFYLFITHFLIMTILIAVLTNSFADVTSNAHEEHQYLFAVNTITMIKSESSTFFSYTAPLNLLEWAVRPCIYVMPLRSFLVLNRTLIKITHFPFLLTIFIFEKLHLRLTQLRERRAKEAESLRIQVLKQSQVPSKSNYIYNNASGRSLMGPSSSRQHTPPQPSTRPSSNFSRTNSRMRVPTRAAAEKRKPTRPKKVSNDDLLDEVFKRPYKGTVKAKRPSVALEDDTPLSNARFLSDHFFSDPEESLRDGKMDTEINDADSENNGSDFDDDDDDDDDEFTITPSAGAALFHSQPMAAKRNRPRKLSAAGSSVSPVAEHGLEQYYGRPRERIPGRQIDPAQKRSRLFSSTSSMVRQGAGMLALSPTRSVMDRQWSLNRNRVSRFHNVSQSSVRSRAKQGSRRRPWSREYGSTDDVAETDEVALEDEYDDSEFEGDEIASENERAALIRGLDQAGQFSEEIHDMTRLIMRRMEALESGFKNMECILEKVPELMQLSGVNSSGESTVNHHYRDNSLATIVENSAASTEMSDSATACPRHISSTNQSGESLP